MQLQRRKRKNLLKIPLLVFLGVVVLGIAVIFGLFHIRTVDVIGNEFYSAEEIQNMVMSDSLAENSIYLTWKYSNEDVAQSLPFLNSVEISMISPYHVQIKVYEKTIAGYLMYSGSRVYFDTDGNVVEISGETRQGIWPFSGIAIGQPVIGEKLPVEDSAFLDAIIEGARLIRQSGLTPDEIHYDENQEMILYFGSKRVMLGDASYLEGKVSELTAIYPQMEGLSAGTLHLETYTPTTTAFTYRQGERGAEEAELIINATNPESGETDEDGNATDEGTAETVETDADGNPVESSETDASGYVEDPSRITTDASGNQIYTDELGNVTTNLDMPYLGEDGEIISDGYGYIDPYTGAYVLN